MFKIASPRSCSLFQFTITPSKSLILHVEKLQIDSRFFLPLHDKTD